MLRLTHTGSVNACWLMAGLGTWLAANQLLLLAFLGHVEPVVLAIGGAATGLAGYGLASQSRDLGTLPLSRYALCLLVALSLMALGGEGRIFYANVDWQVRDAVLRDMAIHPWPFAYDVTGHQFLLRAPIGMYLAPALAWKIAGEDAGSLALLLQNSLLVGTLLALGSMLFETRRARCIALGFVLGFGGLDWLGNRLLGGGPLDHLENWNPGLQFSSNVTLAFWAPQHAIMGWLAALAFLLYSARKIRLGAFLALLPLTALWSPLALIGAMPWALMTVFDWLRSRDIASIAWPALSSIVALPGLVYLGTAGDGVGLRINRLDFGAYVLFQAMELVPWLVPAIAQRHRSRFGVTTPLVAGLVLILLPSFQIGWSSDLMMRGSITSLTILAVLAIDSLVAAPSWTRPGWHWWLAAALALSLPTAAHEVDRAVTRPAIGHVRCSFFKAWDQSFAKFPKDSYLAPLDKVNRVVLGKSPAIARVVDPATCWDGDWYRPPNI